MTYGGTGTTALISVLSMNLIHERWPDHIHWHWITLGDTGQPLPNTTLADPWVGPAMAVLLGPATTVTTNPDPPRPKIRTRRRLAAPRSTGQHEPSRNSRAPLEHHIPK